MKKLFCLLWIVFLISCYTYTVTPIEDIMNEWIGKTEHDVVLKMGSPNSTVSDGASGKIIRYEKSSSNSTTTYGKYPFYNPATTYNIYANTTTITQTWYAEFFIDSTKKVYNWRTNYPDLKVKNKPSRNNAYGNGPDNR